MREFHALAECGKKHRMVAHHITTAHGVHPDFATRASAHIAEAPVANIVVVLQPAHFREGLGEHLRGAARRVFFHPVMRLDDFQIKVRPEDFRRTAREPQQRVHARRIIAGIDNRDMRRRLANLRHALIGDAGRSDDECLFSRHARGEHAAERGVVTEVDARIGHRQPGGKIIARIRRSADGGIGKFRSARDEGQAHPPTRTVDVKSKCHVRILVAAATRSAPAGFFGRIEPLDREVEPLQGNLLAHFEQQIRDRRRRLLGTRERDAHFLTHSLRELLRHLTIQRKREIRVQLFLKLKKLLVAAIPRALFKHHEHDLIRRGVDAHRVEDGRIFHAIRGGMFVFVLAAVFRFARFAHPAAMPRRGGAVKFWKTAGALQCRTFLRVKTICARVIRFGMTLTFTKMNGAGNDFVMLDNRSLQHSLDKAAIARICDRHRGVGGDGLIAVEPAENGADFKMRYYNADGGEAEMCGNGARCFARFASRVAGKTGAIQFETLAGVIGAELIGENVRLSMSKPHSHAAPTELAVAGETLEVHFLNTGVPHAVVFVADLENTDIVRLGRTLRHHTHFAPKGTNANFIGELPGGKLAIRTYERGVEDETLACGTGLTAAALLWAGITGAPSPVSVLVRGGETMQVGFEKDADGWKNVTLTGPADFTFDGQVAV